MHALLVLELNNRFDWLCSDSKKLNHVTRSGLHAHWSQSGEFCGGSQKVGERP